MGDAMSEHAVPAPIRRRRAVKVFGNRFGTLYDDEVESPSGTAGRYLRWQWAQEGVVVVPTGPRGYAFVPTYRYPIGEVSLEFPRGGCEPGEAPARAAEREMREETGYACEGQLRPLGVIHAETGLIESRVHVFAARVADGPPAAATSDPMESVTEPVWASPDEVLTWLRKGAVTCGVTLAALALAQGSAAV
ncbi:NUDIX hydrolase [Streptomyces sp. NPDC004609]|uniref:NUDIX hydrolase n=1 Tax=Streptomyces sp. NPDC004609 TaxID=3364704 RepID=UPI003698BB1A